MASETLAKELHSDPLGVGYSSMLPDQPGRVAELINSQTRFMHRSKMISYKGLYRISGLGPDLAPSILAKIRASAPGSQILYDVQQMLYSEEGFDIGDPVSISMLEKLYSSGVFTRVETDALKAISWLPCSRGEELGIGAVSESDVSGAW